MFIITVRILSTLFFALIPVNATVVIGLGLIIATIILTEIQQNDAIQEPRQRNLTPQLHNMTRILNII